MGLCIHGTLIPNGFSAACRREIPDVPGDAPDVVAFDISNSILDLLDMIQENDAGSAHSLSDRNLGLIEVLLDDQGLLFENLTENEAQDSAVAQRVRTLMMEEFQQQTKDLRRLNKDALNTAIEAIRKESSGKSLFDDVWFS